MTLYFTTHPRTTFNVQYKPCNGSRAPYPSRKSRVTIRETNTVMCTEGEGFEPPGLFTQLFSRQPQSTTLPSLHTQVYHIRCHIWKRAHKLPQIGFRLL